MNSTNRNNKQNSIDRKILSNGDAEFVASTHQIEHNNYITGANHARFAIYCLPFMVQFIRLSVNAGDLMDSELVTRR